MRLIANTKVVLGVPFIAILVLALSLAQFAGPALANDPDYPNDSNANPPKQVTQTNPATTAPLCDGTADSFEWHWNIAGSWSGSQPKPSHIHVTWSNSSTQTVALDTSTSSDPIAHYRLLGTAALGTEVDPANTTAIIYYTWNTIQAGGDHFVLSHSPCHTASIAISSNATNNVGDPHSFTITVTASGPLTSAQILTTPTGEVGTTCASPTISANTATCTLVVNSTTVGVIVANATATVTFADAFVLGPISTNTTVQSTTGVKTYVCKTHSFTMDLNDAGKSATSYAQLNVGGTWSVSFRYRYSTDNGTNYSNWTYTTGTLLNPNAGLVEGVGSLNFEAIVTIPTDATATPPYTALVQWNFGIFSGSGSNAFPDIFPYPSLPKGPVTLANAGKCTGSDFAVSPVTDITVFKGLGATSIFDFPATGLTGWTITATSGNTSFSTVTGAGGSAQIQNLDELVQWTICETLQNGWTQTFPTSNGGCYVRAPQTFLSGPDYVFGNKKNLNISTTLKDGLGNTIVVGGEAAPGALPTVHDTATVTGALQDIAPANSVSFTWFTNGTCNGDGTAAGTAALVGTLADGSTAQGPLSAGSYSFRATIAGDANYVGATSDCEPFTVTTVTIIKSSNGNPATFNFTLGSLSPSITTQAGTPNQGTTTVVVTSGAYTLSEAQQNGWVLVNISCPAPSGNASFTAAAGTNTTCSVENTATGATRTQGFWASHTDFSNNMWNTYVSPTYNNFCGTKTITATTGTNTNQLMGAFWASINSMSTGAKRSDIDQARMQLAQQLAAAMLNKYALGADDQGKVGVAMAAYCTSSTTSTAVNAIKNQVGVLSTWNASGDNVPLTFPYQHATPNRSKLQAYIAYWNTPK